MKTGELRKQNINCFVASALGYDDVDKIYDKIVRPILSEFKINAIRVDRVEHNDDIDDKIFGLIDKSEFCIADLTYARPSVYYEAGYACGAGKPVIYMARHDHFNPKANDPVGNLKVHFDLQMKNIIPWTEPNNTLKNKLRKRIQLVIKPIIRKRQLNIARLKEEEKFASISQTDRMAAICKKAVSLFKPKGLPQWKGYKYKNRKSSNLLPYRYFAYFGNIIKDKYCDAHLIVVPAFNKRYTKLVHYNWWWTFIPNKEIKNIKSVKTTVFFVALSGCRHTTIQNLFPYYTPVSNSIYVHNHPPTLIEQIPQKCTVAVIDGVKSLNDFVERFKQHLSIIELK